MLKGYNTRKPRQKRKEKRRFIPFNRISAEVRIEATKEVFDCRVFLNDLGPTGVGCFVTDRFEKGEAVSITFEKPQRIYLRGVVAWCSPYTLSPKVITKEQFSWRIGIKFLFETPEEAAAVKKFCEDILVEASKR
jgi:hypothetical protein